MIYVPLSQAKWQACVKPDLFGRKTFYWTASTNDNTGLHSIYSAAYGNCEFNTREKAIDDFKQWASTNNIPESNYSIW